MGYPYTPWSAAFGVFGVPAGIYLIATDRAGLGAFFLGVSILMAVMAVVWVKTSDAREARAAKRRVP